MCYPRLLVTGCILFLLTGCFQIKTVVRVNPDGSGTVEESMLLSKKMVAQIDEMMQGFAGDTGQRPKPLELFEPAKFMEKADAMGVGVTYLSGDKLETADYTGYRATYAFTDINQLKLQTEKGAPTGEDKPDSLPITFHFSKGSPACLTIVQPHSPTTEKATATPAGEPEASPIQPRMSDAASQQLVEMFMGMKFVLAVEVNGTIISTNATHRSDNRLTIVDFDLARFGTSGPELAKLSQLRNSSFQDAKELFKQVPGIKVDMNDEVTVVFKK